MKTISQLRKYTSSIQSMAYMNQSEADQIKPEVGFFFTRFMHTDRYSTPIVKVEGNKFWTENGGEYEINTKGQIIVRFEQVTQINPPEIGNSKAWHDEYKAKGGTYGEGHPVINKVVPGMTRIVKRRSTLHGCRITPVDLTYIDPHF